MLLPGGQLLPNTELGHLQVDGEEAEAQASSRAKEVNEWSYKHWAGKLSRVLAEYEMLFSPALFIVGGDQPQGTQVDPLLTNSTPVVPANLRNTAGIVGAAMAAEAGMRP